MADFTYDGGQYAPAQTRASGAGLANVTHWIGAGLSLALIAGIGIWGYKLVVRDVSGVPVVRAMEGPMRIAPSDPGGQLADNQGLAVNEVAGLGEAGGPVDRLVLAPRPPGLSSEDVAQGQIATAPLPPASPAPRRAANDPAPQLGQPQPQAAPADDPILQLAEQLAAGITPLSSLEPVDDSAPSPLVTAREAVPDIPPEPDLAESAPEPSAAPDPGPGLRVSLVPRPRPAGLQVAALDTASDAAPASTAPGGAPVGRVTELDPATLPPGTRLVQIGAFDSPDTARAEWARLDDRFGDFLVDKSRVIERATSGGRVFYRLRAHGFEDLAAARRFCAAFVAGNVDCIPVVTR